MKKTKFDSGLDQTDKPVKLLVIDDDEHILAALYTFLTNIKYNVVSASDGLEGLKLLESEDHGFDLIITDLVMPKVSGNYLVFAIKERYPDIPVIAITGWGAYPEAFATESQADKILEKPFDLPILDNTIKELLSPSKHKIQNKAPS